MEDARSPAFKPCLIYGFHWSALKQWRDIARLDNAKRIVKGMKVRDVSQGRGKLYIRGSGWRSPAAAFLAGRFRLILEVFKIF